MLERQPGRHPRHRGDRPARADGLDLTRSALPGLRIAPLSALPPGLAGLRVEADRAGFRFVARLMEDWASGRNRFDRPGEVLLAAHVGPNLVGMGGLNRDPQPDDPAVGRLRHVYVAEACRRRGIARAIVARLVADARPSFGRLRLRTDSGAAAAFYARQGFAPVTEPGATHALDLRG